MSLSGATQTGRYELLRRIAAGGMGEVFVARASHAAGAATVERTLALKLLLPHLEENPDAVRRFVDEARLTVQMTHPNIVPVLDVGEADGRYFIAMALVEGVSLHALLRALRERGEHLPLPMVRHVALSLCDALDYAHRHRDERGQALHLVHRDVTPSNVLISTAGAVMLTDFGIAQVRWNAGHTRAGTVKGKLPYMPPEQLDGEALDARTDVFAAAATLFETLTLVSPFVRPTPEATAEAIRTGEIPDAQRLRHDAPVAMVAALMRALAPDRRQRLPSAAALREAFSDERSCAPRELGDRVRALFPVAAQDAGSQAQPIRDLQTRSLVSQEPPATEGFRATAPPRTRGQLAVAAAIVAIASAAALRLLSSSDPVPVSADVAPGQPAPEPSGVITPPPAAIAPPASESPKPSPPRRRMAAPQAQSPLRVGFLSANASPWAWVELDGRRLGETPLSRYPLPVGVHQLVFRHPERAAVKRRVLIRENHEARVQVELGR